MKKRIALLLLCAAMLFGCAGESAISDETNASTTAPETVAQTTAEVTTIPETEPPVVGPAVYHSEITPDDGVAELVLISDVHLCHLEWNGMSSEDRIEKLVFDLNAKYESAPYDAMLVLGDLSLDYWESGGSYLNSDLSNTDVILKDYFSRLSCEPKYLIPGNHEQYSNEDWKNITGRDRQYSLMINGVLFLMLDNFAGELDPDYHHHGHYTNVDLDFVSSEMAKFPDAPVVLCAHFFDINAESKEFKKLLKEEERILCLFSAHEHMNKVSQLKNYGNKYLFKMGNYSYTKNQKIEDCSWGWRNVRITDKDITVDYYTAGIEGLGIEAGITQEPVVIPFK